MTGHWASAYLGRPWIAGEAECWDFARDVWRARFGLEVPAVPAAGRDPHLARQMLWTLAERHAWRRVPVPAEGDAVLMARGTRSCHVGVHVAPDAVLHAVEGAGGICTPLSRLADLGYRVAGFYRRVT